MGDSWRSFRGEFRLGPVVVRALLTLSFASAASAAPGPVPPSPSETVPLPMPTGPPEKTLREIPPDLRDRLSSLTLAEVVDLALRNSPRTRSTWAAARSKADEVGIQRAAYY